jgi:TRAP transporter TAXI family solute receptor
VIRRWGAADQNKPKVKTGKWQSFGNRECPVDEIKRGKEEKKMRAKVVVAGLMVGVMAMGFAATAGAETVVFGGGPPSSEWYSIAVAIGNVWQNNLKNLTVKHVPGGGVSNTMSVNAGKETVGISTSETNYNGQNGKPPFKERLTKFKGLVSLYMTYCAIAVWKDSGLRQLKDLKGKVVAPGIKGFTYETLIRKQLQAVGIKYSDLKKVEFVPANTAANLMKDGHVDAAGKTANKFNSFLLDLASQRPIYLIETPDAVLKKLMQENPGIYRAVVNKGDYEGVDKDIQVVGYRLCLIVNENTPEDLVYKLVKSLAENWEKDMHPISKTFGSVKPKELYEPIGVEYHPGALKYFREKGWAK